MSASDNLSPQQFLSDAAGLHKWAKDEIVKSRKDHEVEPGHSVYPREAGRRIARLKSARTWLTDTASMGFYSDDPTVLHHPLHELLPYHPDVVHEYQNPDDRPPR